MMDGSTFKKLMASPTKLSPQDTIETLKYYKYHPTQEVRNQICVKNVNLVRYVMKKLSSNNNEDIFHEGVLGLMRAIEKYEPEKGYAFSTYAYNWIYHYVSRYITENRRLIKIPTNKAELAYKINSLCQKYVAKYGEEPDIESFIKEYEGKNISEKHIRDVFPIRDTKIISLEKTIDEENSLSLGDMIGTEKGFLENTIIKNEISQLIEEAISKLNEDERFIVVNRFGFDGTTPKTMSELHGHSLSKQPMTLLKNSLKKIRVYLEDHGYDGDVEDIYDPVNYCISKND